MTTHDSDRCMIGIAKAVCRKLILSVVCNFLVSQFMEGRIGVPLADPHFVQDACSSFASWHPACFAGIQIFTQFPPEGTQDFNETSKHLMGPPQQGRLAPGRCS